MNEIAELQRGLMAADPDARARCAEHLAELGCDAAPLAVELVSAVGDPVEAVREWAVAALESLGEPKASARIDLNALATAGNPDVAYWAVTLLGRLGPRAAEAVPILVTLLGPSTPDAVRQRAAWALGEIGPAAAPARDELSAAATTDDARLARLATAALARIAG